MPPLNPSGAVIQVGRAQLRTPGLSGSATEVAVVGPTLRAATGTTQDLERALEAASVTRQQVIELRETRETPAPAGATRSTAVDGPVIELEVPEPGPYFGQFVLYSDEAGVLNWALARDPQGAVAPTRGEAGKRTYWIRRAVPTPTAGGPRGLVGTLGKKLLQVLVFPLVDPVLGKIASTFARKWEAANRPYGVRTFTPSNYTQPGGALTDADWARLSQGRALLFVHGTFGRAHGAFPTLPSAVLAQLEQRYGGRLFAFDHFTISDDPLQNARQLVARMPAAIALTTDIVCHSRGGLVSRALAEQGAHLNLGARTLHVGRVAFVASPNNGCVLADPQYMTHFLDRYTNWINFIPGGEVIEILETVLTVLKQLAAGGFKGLDGLYAMDPNGAYLKDLNASPKTPAEYYALGANYDPTDPNLRAFAHNLLMDQIFGVENDLVVPTAGVFDFNGAASSPIVGSNRHIFAAADGVDHGAFFANAVGQQKLLTWLKG